MMIVSHQLKKAGFDVTTYHSTLPELASWFPGHDLQRSEGDFAHHDLIVVENDNSERVKILLGSDRSKLSVFYPSYLSTKHAPLSHLDCCFDESTSMADNAAHAVAKLLKSSTVCKDNGISPPPHLTHRNYATRVLIHPMSSSSIKNWSPSKFLHLGLQLQAQGFQPLFVVSPAEYANWFCVEKKGLHLVSTPTLKDLAALTYESGYTISNDSVLGHLASNLQIPSLVIANDPKRMRLWQPGWLKGAVVFPPCWLPKGKCRRKQWRHFITTRRVLNRFCELVSKVNDNLRVDALSL